MIYVKSLLFSFAGLLSVSCFAIPLTDWNPRLEYQEALDFTVSLSKVRANKWSGNDIVYRGNAVYTLQREGGNSATWTFGSTDLLRLEAPPEFRIRENASAFVLMKLKGLVSNNEYVSAVSTGSWSKAALVGLAAMHVPGLDPEADIKVILKEDGLNKIIGTDALKNETKEMLIGSYSFEWKNSQDASSVEVYKSHSSELAPNGVREFVKSSVRFNYESLCEGRKNAATKEWSVDADIFNGMISPKMLHNPNFYGRIEVRLKTNLTPDEREKRNKFGATAVIEIIKYNAGVSFDNAEGKQQKIRLDDGGAKVVGVFYVDEFLRIINYAFLKIESAKYSGAMPKIGDFSEEISRLDADLKFELIYSQRVNNIN